MNHGKTTEEAADAIRLALAERESDPPSAWAPEDSAARRCMSLGFLLFVCGVLVGCVRVLLQDQLPPAIAPGLHVFAWGSIVVGIVVFWLGIAQMRIGRR